ncbi:MAG: hypothetical protein IJO48_04320 [Clostridia bacterium]|nr:hypothetical protein [Clostridia bacterium]
MKKAIKFYAVIWAALLVLFNVVTFVSMNAKTEGEFTSSFWLGYSFIMLTFIGQFICTYLALKDSDLQKTFYKIPIINISYIFLAIPFVLAILCVLLSPPPFWFGVILCSILLVANIICVIKAYAAAEIVSDIDSKIKTQTFFIRSLTVDVQSLIARANSSETKAECKKVYEAVHYSDPMSHQALAPTENAITAKFSELTHAVTTNDTAAAKTAANEMLILISDRNAKCKFLK